MGRSRRLVSAWAGLFLLFFNVVAGGALATQLPAPGPAADDHLIVCTAGGMAVIDRNGTPVAPEHAGLNGFCGYCLPFMHGGVLGAASQTPPVPVVAPVPAALHARTETALIASPLRLALARAPPSV